MFNTFNGHICSLARSVFSEDLLNMHLERIERFLWVISHCALCHVKSGSYVCMSVMK